MKLLLTGAFKYSKEQLNQIKSLGFEITNIKDEREPINLDVSKIDGVICNALFLYNDIERFKNLKFIHLTSAGIDRVPLDYIKSKGIKLFNAKDVYSIPVAEWVILKILEIYKKSKQFYIAQQEREWQKQRDLLELSGKTASIIGFGNIGEEVAKRLKAFDVNIIGVGRRLKNSQYIDEYYLIDQLDYVLQKSNIVILTLPLNNDTRYLFDEIKFSKMKRNSVLVNVSRGEIIKEEALIEALNNNKFFGVALDVFEDEPLSKESKLWEYEKVIITPHNSFVSENNQERLFKNIIRNLFNYMKGNYYEK